jgi:AcrR family transcriptional regulator
LVSPIRDPSRSSGRRGAVRDPDRRERILDAAADLMARNGYQGVNMTDIGSAAGIVGSGIYRHFDSKNAILVELLDRVVDRLLADAEATLRAD